jgi:hypothetical protein
MATKRMLPKFLPTIAAATMLAAAGCGDSTGPAEGIRIDATPAQLQATRVMVDDVRERLFPSIAALNGVVELQAAVEALADAVARVNAQDVEDNARLAVDALTKIRAAGTAAEAADIAAIDLAIGAAAEILAYPDGSRGNSNLRKP